MKRLALLCSIALLHASAFAGSSDWPQWQGLDRNAVSRERGLLQEWPEAGPPLAWRKEGLGGGYSAPAIAAGRIFGMSSRGADEVVWALSEEDQKELWVTRLGPALREGMPQGSEGPGCTPTVDGDRLYALGMGGTLACLDATDGKVVWTKSLTGDLGGRLPTWRYNESPLVDGGKVVCTPGGDDAMLVALDKTTGEVIWKSKLPGAAEAAGGAGSGDAAGRGTSRGGDSPGRGEGPSREGSQERPAAPQGPPVIVIAAGSTWRHLDTGAAPGPGWTQLEYEDAKWKEGPAQLGYGDGDEKTRLNDSAESYPTYYFRKTFDVQDPAKLKPLILRLLRDDGAVVFLNGREVLRDNMPEGPVEHGTYAAGPASVEDDFYVHELPADRIVAGKNVLAVEVHQSSADSSDVSFDLELREKVPAQDVVGAPRAAERRRGFGRGGSGGGSGAAYASAIAIEVEGQRQYVQFTRSALMGFAAADGAFLWRYDRPANGNGINCSTPIYHDGLVFAASAYGAGGGAVRLRREEGGAFTAEEAYFSTGMQNHHGGMIVVDGCLYGAAGGLGGGMLACLDFRTGAMLWRDRQAPKGSLAMADGRLYLRGEDGTMVLIEPSREKLIERGRFEQPDRTRSPAWTHPILANGKLYLRDQDLLLCYDVKSK